MPGGDNILDRNAMKQLDDLANREVPELARQVAALQKQVEPIPEIRVTLATMQVTLEHMSTRIDEEPTRCPFRERLGVLDSLAEKCESLNEQVEGNARDIAGIQGSMKWWVGGMTAILAAITGLFQWIANLLSPNPGSP